MPQIMETGTWDLQGPMNTWIVLGSHLSNLDAWWFMCLQRADNQGSIAWFVSGCYKLPVNIL